MLLTRLRFDRDGVGLGSPALADENPQIGLDRPLAAADGKRGDLERAQILRVAAVVGVGCKARRLELLDHAPEVEVEEQGYLVGEIVGRPLVRLVLAERLEAAAEAADRIGVG